MKFVVIPVSGVVYNVELNVLVFEVVSTYVVVVIGLEEVVISVVFWYCQMMLVDVVVNFGVYGGFESGDKGGYGFG